MANNSGNDPALIAVMGPTGCGKSSFINLASGSEDMVVGSSLTSQTTEIKESRPFPVDPSDKKSRQVILLDTPGFDDTTRSDVEILKLIATYLQKSYAGKRKLAGVVYMQRISDPRMGGTATRNARMFRKLAGHVSMNNVVIVTTFWTKVEQKDGTGRQKQLEDDMFFGKSLKKGANLMPHDKGIQSAHKIISHILTNHDPEALRIQKQMVDKKKVLSKTDASQELYKVLNEQLKQFEEEMDELDTELQGARREGDVRTEQEIQADAKDLQRKLEKKRAEQRHLGVVKPWWNLF
ncbi:P-loop containing nucleoside triphosphate hydrolase protein [Crepidotus variabilis]|uniref:P-loop containing nucleoside triphosphate hydrolase protein n=1 Tax=Crepidotus variabilis TaxID=179855 RepID=A0A9P6EJU1_9AGAR|nr:P-loop containing nucleoside triphosphate hydrolase protein [Crepidotus variabilis]